MSITLKINHENNTIVMSKDFAKRATDTRTAEYAHLQMVRKDYPFYAVVTRSIKRNTDKETYKGLTYEYMEDYILTHANAETVMADYKELRLIARCHAQGKRYSTIKKWFLMQYPEVKQFGMEPEEAEGATPTESGKVLPTVNPTEDKKESA